MNLHALKKSLDRLTDNLGNEKAERWGLASIHTCGLETTHEDFDDAEAAWRALAQAAPQAGWIQWQSHQTDFKGSLPEPESDWGALLAAEAVVTGTDSLRLDHLDGRWRLTRYRHIKEGDQYLCDETHHLLHGTRDRTLHYRRYWKLDEHQGALQTGAVLIGID